MIERHSIVQPAIDPDRIPFHETEAFRRFGTRLDPAPDSPEDLYVKALIHEQGFDGLPHVVSRRVLDDYVAAAECELFRGLSAAWQADAFRDGEFFVGRGAYSGGANTVAGANALVIARDYARGGVVIRLSLKAHARVADFDELADWSFHERERALGEVQRDEQRALLEAQARTDDIEAVQREYRAVREALYAKHDDIGWLAAYLGCDAIHVADEDYYIVLNRTAVRVQQENLR